MTLFYAEWSASPDDDPKAWATVASANPSTESKRITKRFTETEREAMKWEEYLLERLGIFDDEDDAPGWEVITEAEWEATQEEVPEGEVLIEDTPTFAVEVASDLSAACIVAAGRFDGQGAVEALEAHPGTDWLIDRLVELVAWHCLGDDEVLDDAEPVWVDEGSQADLMTEALEGAGLKVRRVKTAELAQASADLYLGIARRQVVHREDDQALAEAVAHAGTRVWRDVWLWDRRVGSVVLPLIGASIALYGSKQDGGPVAVSVDYG